jgi:hypothetical protein
MRSPVALHDKVSKRQTLTQVRRDVAQDDDPKLVSHELLKDLTRDARLEPKEVIVEHLGWNDDHTRAMVRCRCNQLNRVAISVESGSFGRALKDTHAMQVIALKVHPGIEPALILEGYQRWPLNNEPMRTK